MTADTYARPATRARLLRPKSTATWARERETLTHATPNGFNDPVSVALVVDCLMRSSADVHFTAPMLRDLLTAHYKTQWWDNYTVGRILIGLAEVAAMSSGAPAGQAPIELYVQNGRRWYITRWTTQDMDWWVNLRALLSKEAALAIARERANAAPAPKSGDVWDAAADVRWGHTPAPA